MLSRKNPTTDGGRTSGKVKTVSKSHCILRSRSTNLAAQMPQKKVTTVAVQAVASDRKSGDRSISISFPLQAA
jgi:hypothetical protein